MTKRRFTGFKHTFSSPDVSWWVQWSAMWYYIGRIVNAEANA